MQQNNSTLNIPHEFRILSKQSEQEVSVLPLQSLKIPPKDRRRTTPDNPEPKFVHLSKSKSPTPSRINSAKKIVFRTHRQRYASQEKGHNLEETRMMARERRLNRASLQKKILGLVSPRLREQLPQQNQPARKFRRSEEQRLLMEKKKFKRIKEKPNEQHEAIREKIMNKLMEGNHNFLSGIAEKSEDLYISQLDIGLEQQKGVSIFQPAQSESLRQSSVAIE